MLAIFVAFPGGEGAGRAVAFLRVCFYVFLCRNEACALVIFDSRCSINSLCSVDLPKLLARQRSLMSQTSQNQIEHSSDLVDI